MYEPRPAPFAPDVASLSSYVASELQSVAQAARDSLDVLQLNVLHAEPLRPREGMVICADGTDFQPLGAGGGYFGYFGGVWVKLG
jgi:hypothetical protein